MSIEIKIKICNENDPIGNYELRAVRPTVLEMVIFNALPELIKPSCDRTIGKFVRPAVKWIRKHHKTLTIQSDDSSEVQITYTISDLNTITDFSK